MPLSLPGVTDFRDLLDPSLSEDEVHVRVANHCRIDLADINDACAKHPGLYAYAMSLYEMAEVKEAKAKWEFEETQSRAFDRLAKALPQGQRVVVAEIDKQVKLEPDVKQAWLMFIAARSMTGRFKALSKGFDARGQMLVQISSRQKAENYNRTS